METAACVKRGEAAGAALVVLTVGLAASASAPQAPAGRGQQPAGPRPNVGAADRHRVDPAAADRGRKIYAAECVTCHGPSARGTERGANLIRSQVVLRDRYGNSIGPFLKKGHPMQTGAPSSEPDRRADHRPLALHLAAHQRHAARIAGVRARRRAGRRRQGRRGLLQRRGPLRHLPLGHRRSRRLRQALSARRDPAALRVPQHRRRPRAAAGPPDRRGSRSR